jgi:exonuclease III
MNFPQIIAVSGMISTEFIAGRPFGGCAILYCKSLAKSINTIKTGSMRFCAISFTCHSISILMICVYPPTNYGTSQSQNLYLEVLRELKGFIDTQIFDKIVTAGDLMLILCVLVSRVNICLL